MEKIKELEEDVDVLKSQVKRIEQDIENGIVSSAIHNKLKSKKSLLEIKEKEFEAMKEIYPHYNESKSERRVRLMRERQILFNRYEKETNLTATKKGEPYEDWEMGEILDCDLSNFSKQVELAKRFNRTFGGIRIPIKQKEEFERNGKFSFSHMQGNDHYTDQIKRMGNL